MLELTGGQMSIADVIGVAYGAAGSPLVALSADAQAKVKRAADGVQTLVARGQIAYGITTGFGAFKDHLISPDQAEQLQRNILFSHAVGVGEPFDTPTTRSILLIRANTLACGYSGI